MAISEVEFHTGVSDPLGFACRLLRKASRRGVRVLVTSPQCEALDRLLWTFDERDFVPHARCPGAAASVLARSSIWLAEHVDTAAAHGPAPLPTVLVNVGVDDHGELSAFDRVIEIVGDEPELAEAGRMRWRAYKARGLAISHHVAGRSAA